MTESADRSCIGHPCVPPQHLSVALTSLKGKLIFNENSQTLATLASRIKAMLGHRGGFMGGGLLGTNKLGDLLKNTAVSTSGEPTVSKIASITGVEHEGEFGEIRFPDFRMIDGGYVDNTNVALTLGAMQRDASGETTGQRRLRLISILHAPSQPYDKRNLNFRALFADPDPDQVMAFTETLGRSNWGMSTETGLSASMPSTKAPMPQIFANSYPNSDEEWHAGVVDLAPTHHWPENVHGPDLAASYPSRPGFFSSVLTTVKNDWYAVEAGWEVDVLFISPMCNSGTMGDWPAYRECAVEMTDGRLPDVLRAFVDGGSSAVNTLFPTHSGTSPPPPPPTAPPQSCWGPEQSGLDFDFAGDDASASSTAATLEDAKNACKQSVNNDCTGVCYDDATEKWGRRTGTPTSNAASTTKCHLTQIVCVGALGLTNSGGGLRAMTAAMAVARALVMGGSGDGDVRPDGTTRGAHGLLADVDYIGSISGGNWFSSLLAYEPKFLEDMTDLTKDMGTVMDEFTARAPGNAEYTLADAWAGYQADVDEASSTDDKFSMRTLLSSLLDQFKDWFAARWLVSKVKLAGVQATTAASFQWADIVDEIIYRTHADGGEDISKWTFDNRRREGLRTAKMVHLVALPPSAWSLPPEDRDNWPADDGADLPSGLGCNALEGSCNWCGNFREQPSASWLDLEMHEGPDVLGQNRGLMPMAWMVPKAEVGGPCPCLEATHTLLE